jgi:hypothetical protein
MQAQGVSLAFLREIRDIIGQPLLSSHDVSVQIDGWSDLENICLAQLITDGFAGSNFPRFGLSAHEACGRANVYVCHSRHNSFSALVSQLEAFSSSYQDTDASTNEITKLFFWIDFLCYGNCNCGFGSVVDVISGIAHTLLVISGVPNAEIAASNVSTEESIPPPPGLNDDETKSASAYVAHVQDIAANQSHMCEQTDVDEDLWRYHPFCRAWCLWELAVSSLKNCEFSIQASEEMISDLVEHKGGLFSYRSCLNFGASECSLVVDKEMLDEISATCVPGGVAAIDDLVREYIDEWVAAKKLEISAAAGDSSGDMQVDASVDVRVDDAQSTLTTDITPETETDKLDPEGQSKEGDPISTEDPNKISLVKLDVKSGDDLFFTCPYEDCEGYIVIAPQQVNCGVFRHAVMKTTGRAVNPHASRAKCEELLKNEKVFGCARPFRLKRIKKGQETFVSIEECGWV